MVGLPVPWRVCGGRCQVALLVSWRAAADLPSAWWPLLFTAKPLQWPLWCPVGEERRPDSLGG